MCGRDCCSSPSPGSDQSRPTQNRVTADCAVQGENLCGSGWADDRNHPPGHSREPCIFCRIQFSHIRLPFLRHDGCARIAAPIAICICSRGAWIHRPIGQDTCDSWSRTDWRTRTCPRRHSRTARSLPCTPPGCRLRRVATVRADPVLLSKSRVRTRRSSLPRPAQTQSQRAARSPKQQAVAFPECLA